MKKAQSYDILNWAFIRIFFLLIIVGALVVILTSHYTSGLNSREVENLILIKRLTYSPNLLAYTDARTGRVYPGIIDLSKFSTNYIENNLLNKNKRLAVNMELTDIETGELKRAYINEQRARAWDDYVAIGGYDLSTLRRYVRIYDQGEFRDGLLRIKVIIKK
jgi:hypothetical protein